MGQFLFSEERFVNGNIRKALTYRELKVNIAVFAEYERGAEGHQGMNFKSKNEILTRSSKLADFYSKAKSKLLSEMEEFEIRISQWKLSRI
jgi:hypothetical protein